MNEELKKIDPLGVSFVECDALELSEKIGYALREAAHYLPISFGKHILPSVKCEMPHGGMTFSFSTGLDFDFGNYDELVRNFPQYEADIKELKDVLFTRYEDFQRNPLSQNADLLAGCDAISGFWWGGHANPDFGRVINLGTDGIREIIEKHRPLHPEEDWFYRGSLYALEALDILGERFRELAVKMAEECDDAQDKKRYELAAKAFEVIPKKPAYDFTSACHAFWLVFSFDGIDSPGRFDQYMYRAYEASCDREEVLDILGRVWEIFHDTRTWNLCLSGSDENWNDDTNDLTYDILKLAAEKKYQTPNITLRVHRNTPEKLWDAIADTLATGIGMPALYNDEVVCPAFEKIGIPPCDSHLYCMNGCNQIDIMGKSHMGLEDGEVSLPKCLEFALYNGEDVVHGGLRSIKTGDPTNFKTYEEFERAVIQQMDFVCYQIVTVANGIQHARAMSRPNPYRSCLIEGCLENGVDYRNGGPLYGHGQILAEGIADTGDSLYAIKKLVYDEKKYTMAELIEALKANFEGYDKLQFDFANCEKFGNDAGEVDEITSRILNRYLYYLKRNRTYRGGVYTGGCSPFSRAADHGGNIGALPNGKKKYEPLIADAIGATPGRDTCGPTALLKSALKYNHTDAGSGFILMIKFDKHVFETEKGRESFKSLAKSYFAGGGQQLTTTVVNPEDLLDALEHPENHRDLIVRVGGYSDYFVNISRDLQDNVIKRTFAEMY